MVGEKYGRNRILNYKKRKRKSLDTNKTIDKITYNPIIHKQKFNRKLRRDLQQRSMKDQNPATVTNEMKFASMNVNGLDLEAASAIETMIVQRKIDVSIHQIKTHYF